MAKREPTATATLSAPARAEARPGYKHTKLGWIPEEWEVERVHQLGSIITGSTPSTTIREYYGCEYMFIGPADLGAKYTTRSEKALSALGWAQVRQLPKGAVLCTCIGSTIGKMSVASEPLATNQQINAVVAGKGNDPEFIYYALNCIAPRMRLLAGEQAVPMMNKTDFGQLEVLRPPLSEQRRIAQVMGAWDRAIATVQQLLAAQQERKRGLMQELLTGRRRFKGFGGKWRECELGELGQFRTSSVDKKLVDGQKRVRLVNYMDVYNNQRIHGGMTFMEVTAKDSQLQSSSLRRGDILFTPSSETPDDIGHSAVVVEDMANTLFSYHVMRFRPHDDALDIDFRAYVFNNDRILKQFSAKATGSTRYTLSASDFGDTLVSFPSDKAEQQAIARTLMACDAEIEALTNQLDHLTTQKRGLMQQLLTGAVRVKV